MAIWCEAGWVESVDRAAGDNPDVGLSGGCGDVLEVGVVVHEYRAVELGDRGRDEIDDPCCPVLPFAGHQLLDFPGAVGDGFVDREVDVQRAAALRDVVDIGEIPAGVAGLQIDGEAGCGRSVCDESGNDVADKLVFDASGGGCIDEM